MELVLAVTILNKAGGAFGILSLLTGHPINFWQWLYNTSCLIMLPIYIGGLTNLFKRFVNVRKMSLVCLLYTFDTILGVLYTLYFTYFWFSSEDVDSDDMKRELGTSDSFGGDTSQSASPARELFLITSSTLITTAVRFYFNLVITSFTRQLIKLHSNDNGEDLISDEEQAIFQSKTLLNKVRKYFLELEIKSKEYLTDILF